MKNSGNEKADKRKNPGGRGIKMDLEKAKWITAPADMGQAGPLFTKEFFCEKGAAKAVMHVSAVGLYKLFVNGTAYSFGLFNKISKKSPSSTGGG